jgi:hypothetical protein
MDQHPIAGLRGIVVQQPYIDLTPHAGYFDQREILTFRQELDDPAGYG